MVDTAASGHEDGDDSFAQTLTCREIKEKYVDWRILWYETHTNLPRIIYRLVGISTIILSVTLPALASASFKHKELVISGMSVAIAALTGLGSLPLGAQVEREPDGADGPGTVGW